jgi:hypothetical protein
MGKKIEITSQNSSAVVLAVVATVHTYFLLYGVSFIMSLGICIKSALRNKKQKVI